MGSDRARHEGAKDMPDDLKATIVPSLSTAPSLATRCTPIQPLGRGHPHRYSATRALRNCCSSDTAAGRGSPCGGGWVRAAERAGAGWGAATGPMGAAGAANMDLPGMAAALLTAGAGGAVDMDLPVTGVAAFTLGGPCQVAAWGCGQCT